MRAALTFGIALWTGLALPEARIATASLTVRVYNYASVSDKTLSNALRTAGHIFRRAGIETEWIGCPEDRKDDMRHSNGQKRVAAADVILHIVPQSMEGYEVRQTAYGFALPSSDGRPARHAYVFFRRVGEGVQQSGKVRLATLLGCVIAHEIGHLLLGPSMHAERGIMRPRWEPHELREMERGALAFSPEQARRLQVELQERAGREKPKF